MRIIRKIYAILSVPAVFIMSMAHPSLADARGHMALPDGKPPATRLVEMPQDALRLWYDAGIRGRAVVVLDEDLPLLGYDGPATEAVLKDVSAGNWDAVVDKGYPVARTYPINRASYLYFANRAGVISRVYWAPPTKLAVGDEYTGSLKKYLGSLGASGEELAGLKQTEKSITVTVNGVPVYIARLSDMPEVEGKPLLAIDLTFFTPFYSDEVKTPMLDLFGGFMRTLTQSGLHPSEAAVSYSTLSGAFPMEKRFLGGYIEAFISKPESVADGPPVSWQLRAQGMYYDTFFQVDESLKAYKEAVEFSPADASLRYDLALAYYANKDIDHMKEELDRTVALDRGYYPAYIIYAKLLINKDVDEAVKDFLDAAEKYNPGDPRLWETRHELYVSAGNSKAALAAQERFMGMGYNGPLPLSTLAYDLARLGRYAEAIDAYTRALSMTPVVDTESRPKMLMGLAESYEKTGKVQLALDTYKEAFIATSDGHSRDQIRKRHNELEKKWGPFLKGGEISPSPGEAPD
jgi:tetratricopeptide (TPR) repeat protein